jgi:hypothetical protein
VAAPGLAEAGGLAAWVVWVRTTYAIDPTGEELLRLITEAGRRYAQARDVLDREGLTTVDGRIRPEAAIEKASRLAITQLIRQLDLEDGDDATAEAPAGDVRRFPRVG